MAADSVFINPAAQHYTSTSSAPSAVAEFHRNLPGSNVTALHFLEALAKELSVKHVALKDESTRFGLPSFKIAGASWGVFRAVAEKVGLPPTSTIQEVAKLAAEQDVKLVTSTAGNWGFAVSRMARYLGITARVFVPSNMTSGVKSKIESEGSEVIIAEGGYSAAAEAAEKESRETGALLAVDYAWDGYETMPVWVVEGYSTILRETDEQLKGKMGDGKGLATHVFVPVGGGVLGLAVTEHYKAEGQIARVIAIEPDTAACLQASLKAGESVTVETGDSIMYGMNTGTLSSTSWPSLRDGVDAAVTITDKEDHGAVQYLRSQDIHAGPCGASGIAALRKVIAERREELAFGPESTVVIFCTEGSREYKVPT